MTATSTASNRSAGVVAGAAVVLGLLAVAYGLLVLTVSVLGGLWITAIGLALALSGAFAVEWTGDRLGLAPATRRRLALSFAGLSVLLLVAFLAVNGATFQPGSASGPSA